MPMQAHEIEALLRETFPDATIQVGGDDGVHMSAMVIDESFRGMNRVQQQSVSSAASAAAIASAANRFNRARYAANSASDIAWKR